MIFGRSRWSIRARTSVASVWTVAAVALAFHAVWIGSYLAAGHQARDFIKIGTLYERASDRSKVIKVDPSVAGVLLETGERLVYHFGGGGGWGDPLLRDPQAVLEDVWDEYVSIEGAARDYGVVITGSLEAMDLAVDAAATEARRDALRAARS